jgi:hypothetical protein
MVVCLYFEHREPRIAQKYLPTDTDNWHKLSDAKSAEMVVCAKAIPITVF